MPVEKRKFVHIMKFVKIRVFSPKRRLKKKIAHFCFKVKLNAN